MNGIININKPIGMTSHDVVNIARRSLSIKRIGHTGTLDPDAEGVLPICIGKATKVAELLTNKDKEYSVTLKLGITTDTYDASGKILIERNVNVTEQLVEKVIYSFKGESPQIPPMYSAIRIKGKRLYELARQGVEIERPARIINIRDIDIKDIDLDLNIVYFDVSCSKGTYIRTLCYDIGEKLECGAHMHSLIRTKSGMFTIERAVTVEEFKKICENGETHKILIPIDNVLSQYSSITVNPDIEKNIVNGVQVPIELIDIQGYKDEEIYRVYNNKEILLCISKVIKKAEDKYYLKLFKSFF